MTEIDLITIMAEPPVQGRMTAYDYDFSCAACGRTLYGKDRQWLVAHQAPYDLCREHGEMWYAAWKPQVTPIRKKIKEDRLRRGY